MLTSTRWTALAKLKPSYGLLVQLILASIAISAILTLWAILHQRSLGALDDATMTAPLTAWESYYLPIISILVTALFVNGRLPHEGSIPAGLFALLIIGGWVAMPAILYWGARVPNIDSCFAIMGGLKHIGDSAVSAALVYCFTRRAGRAKDA